MVPVHETSPEEGAIGPAGGEERTPCVPPPGSPGGGQRISPIVHGWVNYFRRGNSARALGSLKFHVERKVRRFAAKQRGRRGFGWKRWSNDVVFGRWGLFNDYHVPRETYRA